MWYYTLNNQQVGPVEEVEIKNLVDAGTITHGTMVWTTGMANWLPIGQSPLASLLGADLPPAIPPSVAAVYEHPEVTKYKQLFMWFWISLIGNLLFPGLGTIAAFILFIILFHKTWKLTEYAGIRANADTATAWLFIPGWGFYWMFLAFRGLASSLNAKFDSLSIPLKKIDLNLPTWMIICLFATVLTFGLSFIAFIVLWIMYTNKIKNGAIAIIEAEKQ